MGRYESSQRRGILEAATSVFAEQGLAGATIRLVAQKAGVNSALIYYYFENKQKLFEEVIRLVLGDFLLMLSRQKKILANAEERLSFLVNGIFDYYATRPDRLRLMVMVFNSHPQLLVDIILELVKDRELLPLAILQEGIRRRQLKPFAPLQLWWNILGMCIFTLKAQPVAGRLADKKNPWRLPPFKARKKQMIELLLSGAAYSRNQAAGNQPE